MVPDPQAEAERVALARLARQAPVLRAALESVRDWPGLEMPGRLVDTVTEALAFQGEETPTEGEPT